ncbi:MAG: alpha/beta hydrolase [Pyrinomonadaceae bacterium]|nr:alpha/beta hydrolase [Pyrinomonadaceae bacterium]
MKNLSASILFWFILITAVVGASAQTGKIVNDQIHAVSLERNLIGDSPNRSVLVYLPPDYEQQTKVRYAVVYLLHGFTDKANKTWVIENEGLRMNIGAVMDRLIAERKVRPMILVMPDGSNKFGGSFYTNSITTGNWENYITRDLVNYVDKKYRTLPNAESRGIVGHSMGGYGAIKLAMKHPDIYGAVYGTSPCCLNAYPRPTGADKFLEEAAAVKSWDENEKASFFIRVNLAYAAAFSPNPAKPPFFADFPVTKATQPDSVAEQAQARWLANTPMWMVDQYRANLLQLRGIAFDAGTKEELLKSIHEFSEALKRIKIQHTFEKFEGDHISMVADRVETRIMPFFSRTLVFQSPSKVGDKSK